MASFKEKEQHCRHAFLSDGPYWHVFTPGNKTGQILRDSDDFSFAMNVAAQSALRHPAVKTITFALMSNHVHFLVSGSQSDTLEWFSSFRKRLARGLGNDAMAEFKASIKETEDLNAIRNVIAYINRNGYVADTSCTPFSYMWGAGPYYFNKSLHGALTFGDMDTRKKRTMFRGRVPPFPESALMEAGYISPTEYCTIDFGMAMFRDAHHYFAMISKNVEAYSNLATETGENDFITDTELFTKLNALIKDRYCNSTFKDLSKIQKLELARTLHYEYHISNGQLRRVLNLPQYEVDSLFPLSAKGKRV